MTKTRQKVIIGINIIFLFCVYFATKVNAKTILTDSDNNILRLLVYTKYLDKIPVVFFIDQLNDRRSFFNSVKNDVFIFNNSTWLDLAIAIGGVELSRTNQSKLLELSDTGIWELYLDISETDKKKLFVPNVKIDRDVIIRNFSYKTSDIKRKYVKIWREKLKIGKYFIKYDIQDDAKEIPKLILVERKERKRLEQLIWDRINTPKSELCYILNKDWSFYLPKSGNYVMNIRILPSFVEDNFIFRGPIIELDNKKIILSKKFDRKIEKKRILLRQKIYLGSGIHYLNTHIDNRFIVDFVIIEPEAGFSDYIKVPQVEFRRVNSTKYDIYIEGGEEPFWLIFGENFNDNWKVYLEDWVSEKQKEEFIAEYPSLNIIENKHRDRFILGDVRYLFKKPLDVIHCTVNSYANGWLINTPKDGIEKNLRLTLFYWPQGLFYLGFIISSIVLLCCIIYLKLRCA